MISTTTSVPGGSTTLAPGYSFIRAVVRRISFCQRCWKKLTLFSSRPYHHRSTRTSISIFVPKLSTTFQMLFLVTPTPPPNSRLPVINLFKTLAVPRYTQSSSPVQIQVRINSRLVGPRPQLLLVPSPGVATLFCGATRTSAVPRPM